MCKRLACLSVKSTSFDHSDVDPVLIEPMRKSIGTSLPHRRQCGALEHTVPPAVAPILPVAARSEQLLGSWGAQGSYELIGRGGSGCQFKFWNEIGGRNLGEKSVRRGLGTLGLIHYFKSYTGFTT